jgi:hypothetical protein
MAKKFLVSVSADFGAEVVANKVINSLKVRQSAFKHSAVRATQAGRSRLWFSEFDIEVPNDLDFVHASDWMMDSLRQEYGGTPFIVQLQELPDDFLIDNINTGVIE